MKTVTPLDLSTIQKFYQKSVILITGCTGFVGQLLLEKLLRSCPDVTIYVLIRKKKGKCIRTRLDELFSSVIFQNLVKELPEFRNKVISIEGDCSLKDLGLSDTDRKCLIEKVNIIFHEAATVRFDENLKNAVNSNIRATEDFLKLSKEVKHLKSFIYVSTLFANCPRKIIEEKFYPPALEYEHAINLAESLPDNLVETVTPQLLGPYPNTYAFTKQIAENVVEKLGKGLPMGVFRPGIIVSTYREPIAGWINNLYGPTGYAAGAAVGIIRAGEGNLSCNANVIPADMTVNFLIASAWDVSMEYNRNGSSYDMKIYNYESSVDKPVTWSMIMSKLSEFGVPMATTKSLWHYSLTVTRYHVVFLIMEFFLHTIPGALVDLFRICMGKAPMMLKVYRKVNKFTKVIAYFSTKNWTIRANNYRKLCDKMSPEDKEIFFCDLKNLNWTEYFYHYILGIRLYLLNDPIETLEAGKIKYRSIFYIMKLPPTSEAAYQHLIQVYLHGQLWIGNKLQPTDWGWKYDTKENGVTKVLKPVLGTKAFAPDDLLYLVSCTCKKPCRDYCRCRKSGVKCSPMCDNCNGLSCLNSPTVDEEMDDIFDM